MKYLCITYHVEKPHEVVENCITLPMEAEVTEDILKHQEESQYVCQGNFSITPIRTILNQFAEFQGYQGAGFTCAHDND